MKIKVYFVRNGHMHEVAMFFDEETYMTCVPALEAKAEAQGYELSESVTYEEETV